MDKRIRLKFEGNQEVEIRYYCGEKDYTSKNFMRSEDLYINGIRHSIDDKYSTISFYEDGTLMGYNWFKDDEPHRDGDKPASIYYSRNGKLDLVIYYKDGKMHRDNEKLAYMRYNDNGVMTEHGYYRNGDNEKSSEVEKRRKLKKRKKILSEL